MSCVVTKLPINLRIGDEEHALESASSNPSRAHDGRAFRTVAPQILSFDYLREPAGVFTFMRRSRALNRNLQCCIPEHLFPWPCNSLESGLILALLQHQVWDKVLDLLRCWENRIRHALAAASNRASQRGLGRLLLARPSAHKSHAFELAHQWP